MLYGRSSGSAAASPASSAIAPPVPSAVSRPLFCGNGATPWYKLVRLYNQGIYINEEFQNNVDHDMILPVPAENAEFNFLAHSEFHATLG